MTTETVRTILSLLGTLCGSFGGIIVSSKLTSYRIEQLERQLPKQSGITLHHGLLARLLLRLLEEDKTQETSTHASSVIYR